MNKEQKQCEECIHVTETYDCTRCNNKLEHCMFLINNLPETLEEKIINFWKENTSPFGMARQLYREWAMRYITFFQIFEGNIFVKNGSAFHNSRTYRLVEDFVKVKIETDNSFVGKIKHDKLASKLIIEGLEKKVSEFEHNNKHLREVCHKLQEMMKDKDIQIKNMKESYADQNNSDYSKINDLEISNNMLHGIIAKEKTENLRLSCALLDIRKIIEGNL